jgi:hypothetical protein
MIPLNRGLVFYLLYPSSCEFNNTKDVRFRSDNSDRINGLEYVPNDIDLTFDYEDTYRYLDIHAIIPADTSFTFNEWVIELVTISLSLMVIALILITILSCYIHLIVTDGNNIIRYLNLIYHTFIYTEISVVLLMDLYVKW